MGGNKMLIKLLYVMPHFDKMKLFTFLICKKYTILNKFRLINFIISNIICTYIMMD